MSDFGHTGLSNSSVGNVGDTGAMQAAGEVEVDEFVSINGILTKIKTKKNVTGFNPSLVAAAKRQSTLKGDDNINRKFLETTSYLAMVQGMGNETLTYPFMKLQIQDHQLGNRTEEIHPTLGKIAISTLVSSAFYAMAETIHWRKYPDVVHNSSDITADNEDRAPILAAA